MIGDSFIVGVNNLVLDYRAREWCKLPYPDHPKGCPSYDKKWCCPPRIGTVEEYLDLDAPLWLSVVQFHLAEHAGLMKLRHPHWSERQARCLLYWQPKVNKHLKSMTYNFTCGTTRVATFCPEAMGVQVIKTAKKLGIPIIPRPQETVYKIALIGSAPRAGQVERRGMKALSFKQPWAWLMCKGFKDIENRNWPTKFRGRIYVHASKSQSDMNKEIVAFMLRRLNNRQTAEFMVAYERLDFGALIGELDIVGCVDLHPSPWFFGRYGFLVANPQLYEKPIPCKGALGFFEVRLGK